MTSRHVILPTVPGAGDDVAGQLALCDRATSVAADSIDGGPSRGRAKDSHDSAPHDKFSSCPFRDRSWGSHTNAYRHGKAILAGGEISSRILRTALEFSTVHGLRAGVTRRVTIQWTVELLYAARLSHAPGAGRNQATPTRAGVVSRAAKSSTSRASGSRRFSSTTSSPRTMLTLRGASMPIFTLDAPAWTMRITISLPIWMV